MCGEGEDDDVRWLLLAVLGLVVVAAPLPAGQQLVLGLGTLVAALALSRREHPRSALTLMALSLLVSARYLLWRSMSCAEQVWLSGGLGGVVHADATHTTQLLLTLLLLAAELYAFAMLAVGYLQSAAPLDRDPVPLPEERSEWPRVDVLIPTVDEPLDVVRTSVLGALSLDWPEDKLRVHLLDDGWRIEFHDFARDVGATYHARPDRRHAKAGNLNHALSSEHTRGDVVAVFDCDHVPSSGFLRETVGALVRDPELALVQTPHHFHTPDPIERNLGTWRQVPPEGQLFYGHLLKGNDRFDAVFFCGSCAVLRRSALDEIGGFPTQTVTEDAHTGLMLHRRGHHTAYQATPLASGRATDRTASHLAQRARWARGMLQLFRRDNPLLGRGLSAPQRLLYATAMLHFVNAFPRLLFMLAPAALLLGGLNIFAAPPQEMIVYAIPHLLVGVVTHAKVFTPHRHPLWSEIYEALVAPYLLLPAALALVLPRLGRFAVTAKAEIIQRGYTDLNVVWPYLLLYAVSVSCVIRGLGLAWAGDIDLGAVALNTAWAVHNLIVLGVVLGLCRERQQRRRYPRLPWKVRGSLLLGKDGAVACQTLDLSMGGARIALDAPHFAEIGVRGTLTFEPEGGALEIPLKVVELRRGEIHAEFGELDVERERLLTHILFGNASRWAGQIEAMPPHRLLRSWLHLIWLGVTGPFRLVVGHGRGRS
jgi:cellulose synthase (UDP-forming)